MLATVYTADLCALTGKVRVEDDAALEEYAHSIFKAHPHADSVRADGEDGIKRIRYRNGITTHHEPIGVIA